MMTFSPDLVITIHDHGQCMVLRLQGELDASSAGSLRQVMRDVLARSPHILEVDLSRLRFADCAGLSVLVSAHTYLTGQGHELILLDAQPIVRRLLAVTGLDRLFHPVSPGTRDVDPPGS